MPNEKLLVSQEDVGYLKKEAHEWSVNAPDKYGHGVGVGIAFTLAKLGLYKETKADG